MAFGLLIAISSASQDITIDALRIEQIGHDERGAMAAGAAVAVAGWWSGYKLGGLISLLAADWFQTAGYENYWHLTFIIQGAMVIASSCLLLLIPETGTAQRIAAQRAAQMQVQDRIGSQSMLAMAASFLVTTVATPLYSFFRQNGLKIGLMILGFILLFKIGEAFMGKCRSFFTRRWGFQNLILPFIQRALAG